jgi:hypothetical protein
MLILSKNISIDLLEKGSCRGRERMVVGFTQYT